MGTTVFRKYPDSSKFEGMKVLNIGCGCRQFKTPNVTNIDAYEICHPDLVWDLSKTPLPFEDNSIDLIIANHIFEHVPDWWECFKDCGRMLKEGGRLDIYVPGIGADSGLGYRDHINVINIHSFGGVAGTFRNESNAWEKHIYNSPANNLALIKTEYVLEQMPWMNKLNWLPNKWQKNMYNWMAFHLRNIVCEMGYIFQKVNDEKAKKINEWQINHSRQVDGECTRAIVG